ncbi:protein translocase subunit SecF [Tissierella sp.]|uniref:protein translocase subunit SecF n=1 Tax=Tissierella sp. TaxID=41274 RepID=UPI002858D41D|nr:protein translocase subunit SecF [Tissierella sp.]MDR7856427.1 protein translocase subunit SecF [Tissierella sp.]
MDVIKNRKIFWFFSLAIIVAGLLMFFINGFNYGMDFVGGTLIQVNLEKFISVDEAKEIMDEYDKDASIVHVGSDKEEIIIKSSLDFSNDEVNSIMNKYMEKYDVGIDNFQSKIVGPSMGKEIKNKAIISIALAILGMLVYITFRFEFYFGVAAIVALLHDMLIMLAVYSIFRIPVNSSFIAAILTILGYSINDTIVIFDRIRENIKLYPKESIENIINNSLKQSMTRTIYTSLTTLIAVFVLYIIGVEDVKVLTLPLIIGMIAGVYSTLFIASPLWYKLRSRKIVTTD